MHFPLQGRFLSLLKREVVRCTSEGANAPRGALERKIEGMTPFVHQSNSLVTSGTKGSCTANRTFTDSRLYEFGTGSFLPSPASRTASLIVASGVTALDSLPQRENFRANGSPAPPWPFSFWLPFSPLLYQQHLCHMLLYHIFLQKLVLPSVGRQEIPRMFFFATSFVDLHEERENMARTSNNDKVLILSISGHQTWALPRRMMFVPFLRRTSNLTVSTLSSVLAQPWHRPVS